MAYIPSFPSSHLSPGGQDESLQHLLASRHHKQFRLTFLHAFQHVAAFLLLKLPNLALRHMVSMDNNMGIGMAVTRWQSQQADRLSLLASVLLGNHHLHYHYCCVKAIAASTTHMDAHLRCLLLCT